jgi:lipopolysaccharide exporter
MLEKKMNENNYNMIQNTFRMALDGLPSINRLKSSFFNLISTSRYARGGIALGVGTLFERILRLIRNMILTRILAPEAFGLMALVMSINVFFESITDVGIRQSIIQNKKGDNHEYLNVAWWFQALRGVALYGLGFLFAPMISSFYQNAQLSTMMRVAFLGVILKAIVSPEIYVLEKNFKFDKSVMINQMCGVIGTFLTVGLAIYFKSAWALVIGMVFEMFFLCLFSYVLFPFKPSFDINRNSLKDVLEYAKGMAGLSFLTLVALQTDTIVLAKFVSVSLLGFYSVSSGLAQQFTYFNSKIIGPVLLSAFSREQDNLDKLRSNIFKFTKMISTLGLPSMVCCCLFSFSLLSILFGPGYAKVSVPFSIMCICVVFRSQAVVLSSTYMAIGKPHLHRRYVLILSFSIILLILPGIFLGGVTGVALVLLFANILALLMQVIWMKQTIDLDFKKYLNCWLPGFGISLIVVWVVYTLRFIVSK